MSLRRAPYHPTNPYDEGLPRIIGATKSHMLENNDDALFIFTGPPGSGKSHLGLHAITIYSANPSIEGWALTQEDLARAHSRAKEQYLRGEPDRYLVYDEADVSRRASMSEWNRDIITLYMTNRLFGILHIWCWPSLHLLDQAFVHERVAGVFLIVTKEKNRPRRYVFFPKASILRLLDENIRLTFYNLKKAAGKYGYSLGWFRPYDGSLLADYAKLKVSSASSIDDDFHAKYASPAVNGFSSVEASKRLLVSRETLDKALRVALERGSLLKEEIIRPTGAYNLSEKNLEVIKSIIQTKDYGQVRQVRQVSPTPFSSNRALKRNNHSKKKEED